MANWLMMIYVWLILMFGLIKKVDLIQAFMAGVKDGFKLVLSIFPTMLAFMLFVKVFESSSLQACLLQYLSPILTWCHIPECLTMMFLLRPLSGSASLSYLNEVYLKYGVDHLYSMMATLIQCGTDTTMYVVSLYFNHVHISKTRYALPLGLFLDGIAMFLALIIAQYVF